MSLGDGDSAADAAGRPPQRALPARAFARLLKGLRDRPWVPVALLAATWVLWGVLPAPGQRIAGDQFLDGMGTQWFYWYAELTLRGEAFDHSKLLFYPFGKDVYLHTGGNLIDAYLALPLRALFGQIGGYNATIVLIFLVNGWGAARLAASFGAERWGQAAAAALLCVNPYVLIELDQGRPTQALLGFLPLGLAALRERRGGLAGVCLALTGYTYWYYGLMAGVAAALAGLAAITLDADRRAVVLTFAVAAVVCVGLVTPAVLPMLESLEQGGVPGLLLYDAEGPLAGLHLLTVEGDKQGLFIQTLAGVSTMIAPTSGELSFDSGTRVIGWVHLLAALPAFFWLRRRGVMLALWCLAGWLVAAGPLLSPTGPANPVYSLLLEQLPMVRRWWWPVRASALTQVGLAVCAGVSLSALWSRLQQSWASPRLAPWGPWIQAAALLPLAWAWSLGQAPIDHWDGRPSPILTGCLKEAPPGAVIDLPLAWDQFHLYDQVWHEKPQMGGMLSKKPSFGSGEVDAMLAGNSYGSALVAYGDRRFLTEPSFDAEARQHLLDQGYRYLVVRHEPYLLELDGGRVLNDYRRLERLVSVMLGPPVAKDSEGPHPVSLWTLDGSALSCD